MGLSLTVTCAAEIPAFHFQGKLLALTGVSGMLHLVLGVFALRLACYFMLPWWGSPWAVLPVELLHGVTFACGWGAGTINCKRVAPPGLEATMQVGGCAWWVPGAGMLHAAGVHVMYVVEACLCKSAARWHCSSCDM